MKRTMDQEVKMVLDLPTAKQLWVLEVRDDLEAMTMEMGELARLREENREFSDDITGMIQETLTVIDQYRRIINENR